jgi:GNAT superfamily N-acetyltransferase
MLAPAESIDPARTPNEALVVGECGPEHREEQARLFNACFRKRVTAADLTWRYDRGPHGPALSLVSRPPGGEGISGYACSPRRVRSFGASAAEARIGETGDVMTHPAWRKRGIFSELDRRAMQRTKELGWAGVFGLPNRHSAGIFLELGWQQVGTLRPWSFLFRGDGAARSERAKSGRLAGLRAPLDAFRSARALRRLERSAAGGLTQRALARFPAEVEALSTRVESRYPFMVHRDAAYLDWRFLDSPAGLHRPFGLFSEKGLEAYVVIQLPREPGGMGFLVDLLAGDPGSLAAALALGLGELRLAGAALAQATAVDGSDWSLQLAGAGFLPPHPRHALIVIFYPHDPSHPVARAAREASRWYLTDGDRDDETMG